MKPRRRITPTTPSSGAPFLRRVIHDLERPGHARFLISTHSPIILSYPGAVLFSLDGDSIREVASRETEHHLVRRDFLNSPERYFEHLLSDADNGEGDDAPSAT